MTVNCSSTGPAPDPIGKLLCQIAAGEENSLAELHAQLADEVLRAASALLVDAHHAEDVTQEVYLQLWLRAARAYDPQRGSGRSFVLALTRRRAIDRIRAVESARRRDATWGDLDDAWDFCDGTLSRIQIQSALHGLGELAHTIVAVYYQGLSYKEIAAQLGVTVITVKNRHRRALIALRRLIQPPRLGASAP